MSRYKDAEIDSLYKRYKSGEQLSSEESAVLAVRNDEDRSNLGIFLIAISLAVLALIGLGFISNFGEHLAVDNVKWITIVLTALVLFGLVVVWLWSRTTALSENLENKEVYEYHDVPMPSLSERVAKARAEAAQSEEE